MTRDEKIERVESLKSEIFKLKKEVDYNNAMQLAYKLVLNGSYGAFATQYFILFNNQVAGTITAEGRQLTKTMSNVNEDYWYNQWHLDTETHEKLGITQLGLKVNKIPEDKSVSVYGDTDSIFVSFKPAIDSIEGFEKLGLTPLEFIHKCDEVHTAQFFRDELDKHAKSYGVENVEDFELEKISESIINIAKKKYIQHIIWEDGIDYERLSYFQPKGVELVRSSTPLFAREKIPKVIKYLFSKPDTFNIKELLKIIKDMRKEFELAEVDSISMQSSCNKYNEKVLDDKEKLEFVSGAHFAVKAAAHHNFLLHKETELHTKYEFVKSGDKIKYYYCNDEEKPIFAFKRGEFPIEFAPEVDYDTQFAKAILSPINSVIEPLGLPQINKRLSVVMDIFNVI